MKFLILILATFLFFNVLNVHSENLPKMKPKIVYVFDPLCGWCYGFTPVVQKLKEKYADQYDFEVISGGMVIGDRVSPITNIAPYISNAYKRVEEYTGVKFGDNFLKNTLWNDTLLMDSYPPSLALEVFKSKLEHHSIDFAHDLQSAFYYDGIPINNKDIFSKLALKYGFNQEEFVHYFDNQEFKQKTIVSFKKSANLGVNGYPTLILMKEDKPTVLTRGYTGFAEIEKLLNKIK
ncbi:MAG: DsbA family protein [Bacteroidota bacterium]|nr:DsbA family protein [Bacteroidota bacterium]